LRSQHQVDEVVQDAFLYLMVTLPELDSEIGVLRFLKWKVRLLCLDVIRASGRAIINNIDEVAEPASHDAEVGSEMEHIEDAAIVRLALSKLNPRHREVLLASMYEEKSTREIASQVGLSENATLQLIFRARAAFKKALLGADVDTNGMSVSAILSVAARKAAEEAKKVSAQAMVFVLFMMLAVGAFVNFGNRNQQVVIAEADRNPATSAPSSSSVPVVEPTVAPADAEVNVALAPEPAPTSSQTVSVTKVQPAEVARTVNSADLAYLTGLGTSEGFVVKTASLGRSTVYDVESETGIRATFALDGQNPAVVSSVTLKFSIGDSDYRAFPKQLLQEVSYDSQGNQVVTFIGSLDYVVDENDWLVKDLALSRKVVKIVVVIDKNTNRYLSSTLQVGPRF
jgi:RNA polymerase sigma-70 factor (ECF subfamily)